MAAAMRPNTGRMPVRGDREVEGLYRNGQHFGPVAAKLRRWDPIPGVSPHDFDITEWRPA